MSATRLTILAFCTLLVAQPSAGGEREFDPLSALSTSFPNSLKYKNHGKLLEFCPDNTCNGFSAAPGVSQSALKDFAFLYLYYFSDYYALAGGPPLRTTRKAGGWPAPAHQRRPGWPILFRGRVCRGRVGTPDLPTPDLRNISCP